MSCYSRSSGILKHTPGHGPPRPVYLPQRSPQSCPWGLTSFIHQHAVPPFGEYAPQGPGSGSSLPPHLPRSVSPEPSPAPAPTMGNMNPAQVQNGSYIRHADTPPQQQQQREGAPSPPTVSPASEQNPTDPNLTVNPIGTGTPPFMLTMTLDASDDAPVPHVPHGMVERSTSPTPSKESSQAAAAAAAAAAAGMTEHDYHLKIARQHAQDLSQHLSQAALQARLAAEEYAAQAKVAAEQAVRELPESAAHAAHAAQEVAQKLPQAAHELIAPDLPPQAQRHNIREVLQEAHRQVIYFIGCGILVVGAVWVWASGMPSKTDKPYNFVITFPRAEGLSEGTPVRLKGVTVGEVSKVAVDLHQVYAHVNIHQQQTRIPRQNTRFDFNRTGAMTAESFIDIHPAVLPKEPLQQENGEQGAEASAAALMAATLPAQATAAPTPAATPEGVTVTESVSTPVAVQQVAKGKDATALPAAGAAPAAVAAAAPAASTAELVSADKTQGTTAVAPAAAAAAAAQMPAAMAKAQPAMSSDVSGVVQPVEVVVEDVTATTPVAAAQQDQEARKLRRLLVSAVRNSRQNQQLHEHDKQLEAIGRKREVATETAADETAVTAVSGMDRPGIQQPEQPPPPPFNDMLAQAARVAAQLAPDTKDSAQQQALAAPTGPIPESLQQVQDMLNQAAENVNMLIDMLKPRQGTPEAAEAAAHRLAASKQHANGSGIAPRVKGAGWPAFTHGRVVGGLGTEDVRAPPGVGGHTYQQLQTCASPHDLNKCHQEGVLVCKGDVVKGHIGSSMDELTRRMVKSNRGQGKLQGIPGIHTNGPDASGTAATPSA